MPLLSYGKDEKHMGTKERGITKMMKMKWGGGYSLR